MWQEAVGFSLYFKKESLGFSKADVERERDKEKMQEQNTPEIHASPQYPGTNNSRAVCYPDRGSHACAQCPPGQNGTALAQIRISSFVFPRRHLSEQFLHLLNQSSNNHGAPIRASQCGVREMCLDVARVHTGC